MSTTSKNCSASPKSEASDRDQLPDRPLLRSRRGEQQDTARGRCEPRQSCKHVEARRLVLESVSFPLEGSAAVALEEMERTALESALEVLILRFARLWGPDTWHSEPGGADAIHVEEAGAHAAKLLTSAPPGTYVITSATLGAQAP